MIIKILFITLLISQNLFTQTGAFSGIVFNERNEGLIGVNVILNGSKLGATTDISGRFLIENIPAGKYLVEVRAIGYKQTDTIKIEIKKNENINLRIFLEQSVVELGTVEISSSRRQSMEDSRVSVLSITPREAKFLPGKAEDVLRSLTSLPGVLSVSDFSSQLVIRGSTPDQNLISIDGFEIINPYRLYGFISMFNPETVSEVNLQTGGFNVKYGDRLSAVLDIKNREGQSTNILKGKINTSITNANLIFEGNLPLNSTWLISSRRTYYDLILSPIIKSLKLVDGDVALPNFTDVQSKIAIPINENNKIIYNGIYSKDAVKFMSGENNPRPGSISIDDESKNILSGISWQFNPTDKIISLTQYSWYQNQGLGAFDATVVDPSQNDFKLEKFDTLGIRFFEFGVDYSFNYLKTTFTNNTIINLGNNTIEFGGGFDLLTTEQIQYITYDQAFIDFAESSGRFTLPKNFVSTVNYDRINLYLQDKIKITPKLYFQTGIRYDIYEFLNESRLSPRFNVTYALDNITTLRGAYGLYYQSPGMDKQISNQNLRYNTETFKNLDAEKAVHYILGIDRMLNSEWQFKTETYLKNFSNLIVPEILKGKVYKVERLADKNIYTREGWSQPTKVEGDSITRTPINDAKGIAYGIEFIIQKIQSYQNDEFSGWISYALSVAERERNGIISPFIYDQRHAMNIVGNYLLSEKWELGINFALRSGRPFANAIGLKPRISTKNDTILVDSKGKVILDIDYEKQSYTGRLKMYHSLDIRLTTYPRWFNLPWSFYIDITNIYNHKNEQQKSFYVDRETGEIKERVTYGLPFFPAIGMSIVF
ncbi:MAG: TonB-dependent receptor [Bacteroidetes bacterium]|nr:TonB-dependent receptor [Bacteroidota bacterium]